MYNGAQGCVKNNFGKITPYLNFPHFCKPLTDDAWPISPKGTSLTELGRYFFARPCNVPTPWFLCSNMLHPGILAQIKVDFGGRTAARSPPSHLPGPGHIYLPHYSAAVKRIHVFSTLIRRSPCRQRAFASSSEEAPL